MSRMEKQSGNVPLSRLLAELQDPAAYPHPVREVRVLQTHTSCVFLTGDYVYKVKKPVDFGFLDYSSLGRRQQCCKQEVLLNRRLCPEIYLDAVPVVERSGRLCAMGPGAPVEWAVRLLQLPQADMLPERLAAGRVQLEDLRKIAAVLAQFHARSPATAEISAFGAPELVARNVEENFTQTEPLLGELLPQEHLEVVRAYSRRFLAENEELFRRRVREGRIREGHGDLRAQNICLYPALQGGVQILDCIEFNDRFRCGDGAADLAYLAMDLDLAGRPDLREILVREYAAAAGDPELGRVLPFYQCYRAYVRGKIALLALQEPEIPPDERTVHREQGISAFDLARSYAARRPRPVLVITTGLSGTGKSTLARELARRLPAFHLSSDQIRKEAAGAPQTAQLGAEHYTQAARRQTYAEAYRRAGEILARGEHVIVDATFLAASDRRAAGEVARASNAEFWVVECRCPEDVARERIATRARERQDPSDAGLSVYEAQAGHYEPPQPEEETQATGWVPVQTDQSPAQSCRLFLDRFWGTKGME
jgi:uncharacterized protein